MRSGSRLGRDWLPSRERATALFFSWLVVMSVFSGVQPFGVGSPVDTAAATEHADVTFEQFGIVADQPTNGDLDISWRISGSDGAIVHRVELRFLDTDGALVHNQHGEFDVTRTGDEGDVEVADILDVGFVWDNIGGQHFNAVEDAEVRVSDSDGAVLIEQVFENLDGIDEIKLDALETSDGTAESNEGVFDQPIFVDEKLTVSGGPFEAGSVSIDGGFDPDNDALAVNDDADESPFDSITYDATTGVLSVDPAGGDATADEFRQLFRNVTYENTGSRPDTTDREITFSLTTNAGAVTEAVYNPRTEHWYERVEDPGISWADARDAADGRGGYLVTIRSEQENAFVRDKVRGAGWIGGSDAAAEGEWHWVTGPEGEADGSDLKGVVFFDQTAAHVAWTEPYPAPPAGVPGGGEPVDAEYDNWNPRHEPDNKFPFRGGQDYAYFCYDTPGNCHDGMWMDASVDSRNFQPAGYIVEYDENPGTDDQSEVLTASRNVTYVASSGAGDPQADAGADVTIQQGDSVELDGSGSTADGDASIVAYEWDVTGNGITDETGETATHTFTEPGAYTVTLTVVDDNGKTDTDTVAIEVRSVDPPVVVISAPDEAERGDAVQFDGTNSTAEIAIESFEWDFGDGSETSTEVSPTHGYEATGDYTVTLTVTDVDGNTNSTAHEITIQESSRPKITDFSLSNPDGQDLHLSVTSDVSLDEITVEIFDTDGITPSPDDSGAHLFDVTTDGFDERRNDDEFSYTNTTPNLSPGNYTARLTLAENDSRDGGFGQEVTATVREPIEPAFVKAEVTDANPDQLRVTFDESVDATDASGFSIGTPADLAIDGLDTVDGGTVILDLNRSVTAGESIEVSYDGAGAVVGSEDGSNAQSFDDASVENTVGAIAPAFDGAAVTEETADQLRVTFDAVVTAADAGGFSIDAPDDLAIDGLDAVDGATVILDLNRSVTAADSIVVSYDGEAGSVQSDEDGTAARSFENEPVDNTLDGVEPELAGAEIADADPDELRVTFDADVEVESGDGAAGFTFGAAQEITAFGEIVGGDTVVLGLDDNVTADQDLTAALSYDASAGNLVAQADGSDVRGFENEDVTNNVKVGSVEELAASAIVATATADGEDEVVIEVEATDRIGQPVAGVSIEPDAPTFDGIAGDNFEWKIATPAETNESGVARFNATSTDAGTADLTFTANPTSNEVTVTFEAGGAESVAVEAEPDATQTAGEVITGSPKAIVTDGQGNPVEGVEVTVEAVGGDGPIAGGDTTIESDGEGIATFDDLVIETADDDYRLEFSIDSADPDVARSDSAQTRLFAVKGAEARWIGIPTQPDPSQTAGEPITGPPTAKVFDAYFNPVAGVEVTVAAIDGSGSISSGDLTAVTDAEGVATFDDLVIDDADDDYRLTFTIDAGDENVGATFGVQTSQFDVAAGDQDAVAVEIQPAQTTAGETIAGPPTANVTDEHGNPVEGIAVTVAVNASAFTGGSTTTVETDGSGLAAFDDLTIEDAGTYELEFDADGVATNATSDAFTVEAAAGTTLSIVEVPETIDAGDSFEVTINATDAFGNPVAAQSIGDFTVTSEHDGEIFDAAEITLDGDGKYTVSIGSNAITTADGEHTITVDADGVTEASESLSVDAADGSSIEAAAVEDEATADGADTVSFTVTVHDAYDNPVEGTTVLVDDAGGLTDLDGASETTDGDGNATFSVTSTNAGAFQVTFRESDAGTDTITATFVAGTPASVSVTIVSDTATANGGDELEFEVAVQDSNDNPVEDVTVEATDNGTSVSYASGNSLVTDASGTATFTATASNAQVVEFTFEEQRNDNAETAIGTFEPGGVDASESSVSVDSETLVANGTDPSTVTVDVRDANGNAITGLAAGDFEIDVGAATDGTVTEIDDGAYEFEVTHTVVETVTIEVTADGRLLDDRPEIEFVADGATSVTVALHPSDTGAGATIAGPPTATVADAFGNPVSGVVVDVATDGSPIADGTTRVVTNEKGLAAFDDLVIEEAGHVELVFSIDEADDTVRSSAEAATDAFAITPAAAASIAVVEQPKDATAGAVLNGPPTVAVTDAYGNPVEGIDVTVSGPVPFADGTTTIRTDESGRAPFADLTIESAGTFALTFEVRGVGGNETSEPFTVDATTVDVVELEPAENRSIRAGETIPFDATAYDRYRNVVEGNDAAFTWANATAEGTFVNTTNGTYTVAAAYDGIGSDPVSVAVEPGEVDAVALVPASEQVVVAGETVQFGATAYDAYDNVVTADAAAFTWENATEGGRFERTGAGTYEVTAARSDVVSIPTTVEVLRPATFSVAIVETNAPITVGETLNVIVTVENAGDVSGTQSVRLEDLEGLEVDSRAVTLDAGESTELTLAYETTPTDDGAGEIAVHSADDAAAEHVTIEPAVDRLDVSLAGEELHEGERTTIRVNATYTDGTVVDVTGAATIRSDDASVASVEPDGTVTAAGVGTGRFTAVFENVTAVAEIEVTEAIVVEGGLSAALADDVIPDGTETNLAVEATFSNGSVRTVTGASTLAAADEGVAVIRANGTVTATGVGETELNAAYGNESATVSVTVTAAEIVDDGLSATLAQDQPPVGANTTVTVKATYTNGSVHDVTEEATLSSANASVASVVPDGTVSAMAVGATEIEAEFEDESASVNLTVGPPSIPVDADASASSYVLTVGSDVEFRGGDSTVPPDADVTYSWDVDGDGTVDATGEDTTHGYLAPGRYNVSLTVSTPFDSDADHFTVRVDDVTSPAVHLDVDGSVDAGERLTFDGSGSTDDVGIDAYDWDFGDGTTEAGSDVTHHAYDEPGRYTVTLTVTDTSGNANSNTASVLVEGANGSLSTDALEFGDVTVNSTVTRFVEIANNGTADLELSSIRLTGADADAFELRGDAADGDFTVRSGERRSMVVAFAPPETGEHAAAVAFESNNPEEFDSIDLAGTGVEGDLAPVVSEVDFGGVSLSSTEVRDVTFENRGDGRVELTDLSIDGAASFSVLGPRDSGMTVDPGETVTVTVEFAPVNHGESAATLVAASEAGTASVSLAGEGHGPSIHLPVDELRFTTIGSGDRTMEPIEIRNYGAEPLELDEFSIVGRSAAHFRLDGLPSSVDPGENETFELWFEPGEPGDHDATVEIASDDPDTPTATLAVGGEAVAADIGIDRRTLDFGNVTAGETVYMNITVRNKEGSIADLSVTDTPIVGTHPDSFEVTRGGAPFTLEPDEERQLEIAFNPLTAGVKDAQLQIYSDAGNQPLINVWLSNTRTYIMVQEVGNPTVNVDGNNLVEGGNHRVNVWTPTVADAPAGFAELNMTMLRGGRFEMDIVHDGDHFEHEFEGTDDEVALEYVKLAHIEGESADTFTDTGVTFRVRKDALTDGATAEDVAIRRWSDDDGEWTDLSDRTTLVDETDEYYEFEVATPGFSEFVVTEPTENRDTSGNRDAGQDRDPAHFAVDVGALSPTLAAGSTVTVTATVENTGERATAQEIELRDFDGVTVATETISLDPGEKRDLEFTWVVPTDGVDGGTLTIASEDETVESDRITIDAPMAVEGIDIKLDDSTATVGTSTPLVVEVTYADGSVEDVTTDADIESLDADVAEVTEDGTVRGVDPGFATIVASYRGEAVRSTIEITGPDGRVDDVPIIGVEPDRIEFGDVVVGDTVTRNLTITNLVSVDEPLSVDGTALVGQHPEVFSVIRGGAPFTLGPGESRDLEVGFTPAEEGVKNAQLRITSDAGNEPQMDVWLANTGAYIVVQEVDANRTDRATVVNVNGTDLDAGSLLRVNVSQPGSRSMPAGFDELAMALVDGGDFEMDLVHTLEPLAGGTSFEEPGRDVIEYVTILHDGEVAAPENVFADTAIEFRVEKAAVATGDPSDVSLHRHDGEVWADMDATLVGETAESYRFVAETPGFSEFVVTSVPADAHDELGEDSTGSQTAGEACAFLGHDFGSFVVCWYWWVLVVLFTVIVGVSVRRIARTREER